MVLDFLIVAFAIFMVVRGVARLQRTQEEAPKAPTDRDCPECLSEIPIAARRCRFCTASVPA